VQKDLEVARIKAQAEQESARLQAETEYGKTAMSVEGEREKTKIQVEGSEKQKAEKEQGKSQMDRMDKLLQEVRELAEAEREVVRGPDGRVAGARVKKRAK
jgi:regulator of protease activity HflC (stomatin/prohibitin superfamily)